MIEVPNERCYSKYYDINLVKNQVFIMLSEVLNTKFDTLSSYIDYDTNVRLIHDGRN